MNTAALSRKGRRALQSEAQRTYGVPGPAALALHEAYMALNHKDAVTATTRAQEVSRSHPDSQHPWVILGIVALNRHEAETARRFFEEARRVAPDAPQPLAGLGKALVLQGDVFAAVDLFAAALQAGSSDRPMIRLYADLMSSMNRLTEVARTLERAAARLRDPALYHMLAEIYLTAEEYPKAIAAFDAEYALAPETADARIGQVKAAQYRHDHARAEQLTAALLTEMPDRDELISLRMTALRNLGRAEEALHLLDAQFSAPIYYKRALAVAAHVYLDQGARQAAGHAFRAADALTDEESLWSGRAYGTFCFGEGRFDEGAPFYARRQPEANRHKIPFASSAPENLAGRKRLYLMQEQGIGDQLALMPLIALAPLAEGAEITFVGDPRMEAALRGNTLGLRFREEIEFTKEQIAGGEIIFVGDLTRYLPARPRAAPLGGYLRPDPARVAQLRKRYRDMATGAPVVGVAWRSGDRLTGWHRSVALPDLAARLPGGALVVNLQYGDCAAELAAASARRPDLTFLDDPEVDQMRDLAAFLAQIQAIDRIVTIDNTTAHACGAVGHADTHVLLPAGAECMWYWGREGRDDPWFGMLHLHRQARPRDWSAPLDAIETLFSGVAHTRSG
ncbi:hypothetical protein U879_09620 [Defluviimonas sp. 20V17]|uniref:Tetratricopeptide repeat protein n=1 Tax=Allgaiera indica TaxID=765699 RepID=A0AAN4ZXY7_9RHOB|nr:hypothetical protein [Allgaiera indica]KDB03935.1 hypothetical protein U879_09620 [Defluviimonas sp. 20V17]GHD99207.1 hypothetical protein GCM10008024_05660 [Allgaiera indica]SDW31351.1 hypothetical protein SAMN05444006_102309 [Allgaiera indica]